MEKNIYTSGNIGNQMSADKRLIKKTTALKHI